MGINSQQRILWLYFAIFISAAASLAPPLMHLVRLHEDITRARAYVRRSMSYSCATVKLIRLFVSIFSRKLFISLNNEGEGPPFSNVNRLVCVCVCVWGGGGMVITKQAIEGGICRAGAHGRLVRLWPAPNFPGKSMGVSNQPLLVYTPYDEITEYVCYLAMLKASAFRARGLKGRIPVWPI